MKTVLIALAVIAFSLNVSAIVVDGVVDPEYGPPIAIDQAGDGNGNANMDLLELYAASDPTYLYVAFTINADIVATDWGKYMVYIDTDNTDNSGATSDAWGRNVVVVNTMHLPEYTVNCWVDSPPFGIDHFQFVPWDGTQWDWGAAGQPAAAALTGGSPSVIEWSIPWTQLGSPGGTIYLEVWNTGGGATDNAQDTINNPAEDWNASDWSTQATLQNSAAYLIPEPGTILAFGLVALAIIRKR